MKRFTILSVVLLLFSCAPVLEQGAWEEEWVSSDGRFRATAEKGLVVSPEMKNLYAALPMPSCRK